MGLLDDIQHEDARFGFFDTDAFGESVTVTPGTGTPYAVKAVVNRTVEPAPEEESQNIKEVMLIALENHSTRGIPSATFNAGTWRISVAYRIGETARSYILGRPVSMDSVQLVFRLK